jgi:hypothetical protein
VVICSRCQSENEEGDRFCRRCGASLLAEGKVEDDDTLILRLVGSREAPPSGATRTGRLWLLDSTGEHVERAFELPDEITTIGRLPNCHLCLIASTVSRRHAQIRREGNKYFVSDLGSTNGTLLNLEPVIGEEQLNDRDEIAVGTFKLIFRYT